MSSKKNQSQKKLRSELSKKQTDFIKSQFNKNVKAGLQDNIFVCAGPLTVQDLASQLHKNLAEITKHFFMQGLDIKPTTLLTVDQIGEVCLEMGIDFEQKTSADNISLVDQANEKQAKKHQKKRSPIVTIMGHVDHGKTTLLEKYRHISILKHEHGGITQQIGAYTINLQDDQSITFIDTPGHAVFTEMRAQGSAITDIVVLVVSAKDGVKAQTKEAISHARAANVPIIVFINKMDTPEADPEKVILELSQENLIAEEFGGDTIIIKGSALKEEGLQDLLDAILLVAELNNLTADYNALGSGVVLESRLDKHVGVVTTIIVLNGQINIKDVVVAGTSIGYIRSIINDKFERVQTAGPSTPVIIHGLDVPPPAGTQIVVIGDEKLARNIVNERKSSSQSLDGKTGLPNLEEVYQRMQDEDNQKLCLNLIIKADGYGTLQALQKVISEINVKNFNTKIIHQAVGGITESDVMLASASAAIIVGFNVGSGVTARKKAMQEKVEIRLYNVIYKVAEDLTKAAQGMLEPNYVKSVIGTLEVRKLFFHSKIGTIAGCKVMNGLIKRGSQVDLLRNGIIIYTGEIGSLKHEKDDIKQAANGQECGIVIKNFNDIKQDDVIEAFEMVISQD